MNLNGNRPKGISRSGWFHMDRTRRNAALRANRFLDECERRESEGIDRMCERIRAGIYGDGQ